MSGALSPRLGRSWKVCVVPWVHRSLPFPFSVLSLQVESDTELARAGAPCLVAFGGIFLKGWTCPQLLGLYSGRFTIAPALSCQGSLVLCLLGVSKPKFVTATALRMSVSVLCSLWLTLGVFYGNSRFSLFFFFFF